jgi:hypothetical protein
MGSGTKFNLAAVKPSRSAFRQTAEIPALKREKEMRASMMLSVFFYLCCLNNLSQNLILIQFLYLLKLFRNDRKFLNFFKNFGKTGTG